MTSEKELECEFQKIMHVNKTAEGISDEELIAYEEYELEFNENEDVVIPEIRDSPQTKVLIPSKTKVSKIEQKDIQFMSVLSRVGGILLSKSLAPAMKLKKKKAAEKMAELLLLEAGEHSTPDQIIKKACLFRLMICFLLSFS